MTKGDWLDLTVLERKKYSLLSEVMDLTQQLGEALDRGDDVSVRMLISMRQEPILQLEELKQAIGAKTELLTAQEEERVRALRDGAAPQGGDETAFQNQAGGARRLLERILELDRRLNLRVAGKDSCYGPEK